MKPIPSTSYPMQRSPSPICSSIPCLKPVSLPYSKYQVKDLIKLTNSYKKFTKNVIKDTSLAYIHKVKSFNLRKGASIKASENNQKILISSSIPKINSSKVPASSTRTSPINYISHSPDYYRSKLSQNTSKIETFEKIKEICLEKRFLNVSFPEIHNLGEGWKEIAKISTRVLAKNIEKPKKDKELIRKTEKPRKKKIKAKKEDSPCKEVQADETIQISAWDFNP